MVQPSISQHRSPKVARIRSLLLFRGRDELVAGDDAAPLRTLMSGATAAAAAHAASKGRYGSRKIKASLERSGVTVSRRRVCRIMRENGLASAYGRKRFKVHPGRSTRPTCPNVVARGFGGRAPRTHICSDLTYVRVGASWNYVCLLVDLYNREIVGHPKRPRRDARARAALGLRALVQQPGSTRRQYMSPVEFREGGCPPGIVQISVANP